MADGKSILVIDDHATARTLLEGILTSAHYDVTSVASAEEGLVHVKERVPDLIIVDMNMPGMTGWEAARKFRAMAESASTAILGVSAHSTSQDYDAAHEAGCDAYVTKPLNPARLLQAVTEVLG